MLCSHQDVVPVAESSLSEWTHPPFEGFVDDTFVWGRGSSDTKSTLIEILSAVEALLEAGFGGSELKMKRGVILAFGHDEEISGFRVLFKKLIFYKKKGARNIAKFLLNDLNLKNGVELIVDEGSGITRKFGPKVAEISTAEKGYMDVKISIITKGGHSSVPPPHTGIGLLAKAVSLLEDHPFSPKLTDDNPLMESLFCIAENTDSLDPFVIWALQHLDQARDDLVTFMAEKTPDFRFAMQTSQAVDIIKGGVKVNALPELASAVINYRIAIHQTIKKIESHIQSILQPFALKYNLSFSLLQKNTTHQPEQPSVGGGGQLIVQTYEDALEPSPRSTTTSRQYKTLAGTIISLFQEEGDEDLLVVPGLPGGNTDTRHYWGLTRDIFRFSPSDHGGKSNVHTVDEKMKIRDLVKGVGFFYQLIRNVDELNEN